MPSSDRAAAAAMFTGGGSGSGDGGLRGVVPPGVCMGDKAGERAGEAAGDSEGVGAPDTSRTSIEGPCVGVVHIRTPPSCEPVANMNGSSAA